jgi:hypothetical protein
MQRAFFETMESIHQNELAYSPDPVCEGYDVETGEDCNKPVGDMEEFCPHCLSTLFGEVI